MAARKHGNGGRHVAMDGRGVARLAREAADGTLLYETKNPLPADTRQRVVALLNARLADCVDLQSQAKQAHWNVKGPQFIALHELFDDIYGAVGEYVDLIAERITQLGGVAEGTVRVSAERSSLTEYPLVLSSGEEHVAALSDVLAQFGAKALEGISELEELEDPDTADILTEVSRGIDKWLWFVEAHQQGRPVSTDAPRLKR
ncbi:MAG TPA: DNA starvation/stationary phase protection protein Dps [Gemmatimonadaceae bacterium]|nr:DNA starvation/stationary phase protection protein Dps [Gemmatimonadaceae bacterium]